MHRIKGILFIRSSRRSSQLSPHPLTVFTCPHFASYVAVIRTSESFFVPDRHNGVKRPFKTFAERAESRGKMRAVRDFFEEISLKNLRAMLKWFWSWLKHRFKRTHKFVRYNLSQGKSPGVYRLGASVRVLLASDWGTATPDSIAIAERMRALEPKPDVTIHLGDVYYTGEEAEYRDYFFPHWPLGSHPTHPTFLLNANHEMYSGGYGYFNYALKQVNQEASYFCLENDHWRIIGLDTGYYSVKADNGSVDPEQSDKVKLPKALLAWLDNVVFTDPNDPRGVIVLSHHQWFCAFGTEYHRPAQQLSQWIHRPALWFWGHEHVFAAYGFTEAVKDAKGRVIRGIPVYARCIGHGGMPAQIDRLTEKLHRRRNDFGRQRELVLWDRRKYRRLHDTDLGFNGFVDLQFQGKKLTVTYYDQREAILREQWEATPWGPRGRLVFCKLVPEPGRSVEELYNASISSEAA